MRALPYAHDPEVSRQLVQSDRDALTSAFDHLHNRGAEYYEFDAHLPEVVGTVPTAEREILENPPSDLLFTGFNWTAIPPALTQTCQMIQRDLRFLDSPEPRRAIEYTYFPQDAIGLGIHINRGMAMRQQASDLAYLIANRDAIIAHAGNGRLHLAEFIGSRTLELSDDFLSTGQATAADYEVIRITRLTVHQSRPPKSLNPRQRSLLQAAFLI